MSDYRRMKKHYTAVFDQLKYHNKLVLNYVTDYFNKKKLNRMARQQILAEIADMVLDYQNRDVPIDTLFGDDREAFCDRLSENAPLASAAERLLAVLRDVAALSLSVSIITVIVSLADGSGMYLSGLRALQIAGGVVLAILYIPLACYKDALHMPNNLVIPSPTDNAVQKNMLPLMILYSVVCITGVVLYAIFFWIYPGTLENSGLAAIRLNILIWLLASAVIFISSLFGEISTVTKNYAPTSTTAAQ